MSIVAHLDADQYGGSTTIVARIYDAATGTQAGTDVALTEGGDGLFRADIPSGLAAGEYSVGIYDGTTYIAAGRLIWDGSREVTTAELADDIAAARSALAVLIGDLDNAFADVVTDTDLQNVANDLRNRIAAIGGTLAGVDTTTSNTGSQVSQVITDLEAAQTTLDTLAQASPPSAADLDAVTLEITRIRQILNRDRR